MNDRYRYMAAQLINDNNVKNGIDRQAEREGKAMRKQGKNEHRRILRLQSEYKTDIEQKAFRS